MTKALKKLDQLLSNTGEMALKRRYKKVVENLKLKDGDRVLDMGCGDGFFLHIISRLGLKLGLSGSDFDEQALKSARRNLKGKKIRLTSADLMKKTTFKSSSYDKIVMNEVVEHLPDDVKGLKEVRKFLKKDGILCLTVPNHNYPFLWDPVNWILERLFKTHIKDGFWAGIWNQHDKLYFRNEIVKSVKDAGFKIEKVECLTHICLPFNHYIMNFGARMLYDKHLPEDLEKQISKFEASSGRSFLIEIFFKTVNFIDSFDKYFKGCSSVNILVVAKK